MSGVVWNMRGVPAEDRREIIYLLRAKQQARQSRRLRRSA